MLFLGIYKEKRNISKFWDVMRIRKFWHFPNLFIHPFFSFYIDLFFVSSVLIFITSFLIVFVDFFVYISKVFKKSA